MSEDIHHECGLAALYWLDEPTAGGKAKSDTPAQNVAEMIPGMLMDLQTRGQLAAGLSSYDPQRAQILDTFKDVGTVSEVFRLSRQTEHQAIVQKYAGRAAIGHTRYATVGADDARYAQPFERHHGRLWKWFAFAFNGTLSNYTDLRDGLLRRRGYHFSLDTDTEIIMHSLAYGLRGEKKPSLQHMMEVVAGEFDGAYCIVFLDGLGRMFVARDPRGIRPMSWGMKGRLFGAANESVALANLGFTDIQTLEPGCMAIIENGRLRFARFAPAARPARCFFEWVYFSNVASQIDGKSVYHARARAGQHLAAVEDQVTDEDCIVVPVPDTAKAAADAYAFHMGVPCMEGIIRNRYVGRTFIQPNALRNDSARSKYTPLPSVLQDKRVFLVEDSIVRSTTLKTLVGQVLASGAKEVHVRVACPPIVSPCFYGIDMSTMGELFAPPFIKGRYKGRLNKATLAAMAKALEVNSLRYLDVDDLARAIDCEADSLCLGCVSGRYPTPWGDKLMRLARRNEKQGVEGRTYE
ncbi:MAG: amidophosphoribosyltransferase [Candidatus Latescibacteria bacterium]|nr:amidophosphoribosyltransferase [Candidatus Latescibacterota bacterium]